MRYQPEELGESGLSHRDGQSQIFVYDLSNIGKGNDLGEQVYRDREHSVKGMQHNARRDMARTDM
ncbi:hypothetical protein ACS0TY_002702 [Phlomoides rotata]